MQIVIHAGAHKTATTPFQLLCARNRGKLSKAGIFYPLIKAQYRQKNLTFTQHSVYARDLSRARPQLTSQHFKHYIKVAKSLKSHTIFLSGEDFENILFDDNLVKAILRLCEELKFKKPIFTFTTRDPYHYFSSLYSELSKKKISIHFKDAALAAASTGYLALPTSHGLGENLSFNNFFAIDAESCILRFKRRHPDLKILKTTFAKFTKPKVGAKFISEIFNPTLAESFDYSFIEIHENKSLSKLDTEINYVKNCLEDEGDIDSKNIMHAAKKRLEKRIKHEKFVKDLFRASFCTS